MDGKYERPNPDYKMLSQYTGIMARTFTLQEDEYWSEAFSSLERAGKCPTEFLEES